MLLQSSEKGYRVTGKPTITSQACFKVVGTTTKPKTKPLTTTAKNVMTTHKDHKIQDSDYPVYSTKKIQAFASGDEESLRLILSSFTESARENLSQFRQLLENDEREAVAELAHKMRSMFLQLEAFGVAVLLEELEEGRLNNDKWTAAAQVALKRAGEVVKAIQFDYHLD